jgi:hypothetical protein
MTKRSKIIIGLAVISGIGIYLIRRLNTRRRLEEVADNGYETASDILFPGQAIRSKKLHYGPVLPA